MTTIITKNGSGAPTAGQLSQGELAVDLTNKELYTKDSGGNVIKVGAQGGSTGTFTDLTATSSFTSPGIDDNATSTAITIDANENVGIGETNPSEFLHITGASPAVRLDNTGGTTDWLMQNTDNSMRWVSVPSAGGSSTERMRINSAGNVGIGTSSPSAPLEVDVGNSSPAVSGSMDSGVIIQAGAGSQALNMGATSTGSYAWINSAFANNSSVPSPLAFMTGTQERMRIDASGNVGYTGKLFSSNDTTTLGGLQLYRNHSSGDCYLFDTTAAPYSGDMIFGTTNAEAMRLDSSGNLLVGTDDGSFINGGGIKIANSQAARLKLCDTDTAGTGSSDGMELTQSGTAAYLFNNENAFMAFGTNATERMRLDSSGNLLVGTTSVSGFLNSTSETGVINYQSGALGVSKSSDTAGYFKRLGNDGAIVELRNSSATTVGAIATRASQLAIGCTNTGLEFNDANDAVIPADINANNTRDNAISLGTSGVRFDDAFITNGVTTGSDERDKQDISALDEAETRVAVACKGLLRKWRWKDAVAEKDNNARSDKTARFHFGIIAQDLKAAFEAEGLDAERYGMFMYDTWTDEETDEERSRMGVRYSELLAFIIAAI